jgi:hypothetical protein
VFERNQGAILDYYGNRQNYGANILAAGDSFLEILSAFPELKDNSLYQNNVADFLVLYDNALREKLDQQLSSYFTATNALDQLSLMADINTITNSDPILLESGYFKRAVQDELKKAYEGTSSVDFFDLYAALKRLDPNFEFSVDGLDERETLDHLLYEKEEAINNHYDRLLKLKPNLNLNPSQIIKTFESIESYDSKLPSIYKLLDSLWIISGGRDRVELSPLLTDMIYRDAAIRLSRALSDFRSQGAFPTDREFFQAYINTCNVESILWVPETN